MWGRSDPPEFYRPLFLPWLCRGVRTQAQEPKIEIQARVDTDSFRRARRALDSLNRRPSYRPPTWLWIFVIAALVLVMKALAFGWKATHP